MHTGEIIIYQTKDEETSVEVKLQGEILWLTQEQMAELFQTDRTALVKLIRSIFKSGELSQEATRVNMANIQKVSKHAFSQTIEHYHLDLILFVGYRGSCLSGGH